MDDAPEQSDAERKRAGGVAPLEFFSLSLGRVSWRLIVSVCATMALAIVVSNWPVIFGSPDRLSGVPLILVLAGILGLLLGLPPYWLLKVARASSWLAFAAVAAIYLGGLYQLLDLVTGRGSGFAYYFADGCVAVVGGVRTDCGWQRFREASLMSVAYGAFAGSVFWLMLRWRPERHVETQTPKP